jgi:hypothetical protein
MKISDHPQHLAVSRQTHDPLGHRLDQKNVPLVIFGGMRRNRRHRDAEIRPQAARLNHVPRSEEAAIKYQKGELVKFLEFRRIRHFGKEPTLWYAVDQALSVKAFESLMNRSRACPDTIRQLVDMQVLARENTQVALRHQIVPRDEGLELGMGDIDLIEFTVHPILPAIGLTLPAAPGSG